MATKTETPIMKQYHDLKAKHPDALMLFRCGDFYEAYEEDAKVCAKVLNIVLTQSNAGFEMAGFPYHALDTYLPKLIRAKHRVAICDQLEDPKLTQKLVKRGITELITPQITDLQTTQTTNNMEANNIQAYVGKTIIVGEGIATIVIKSANGDQLTGEFHKEGVPAMSMPISVERLEEQLANGAWKLETSCEVVKDEVAPATTAESEYADFEEVNDTEKAEPVEEAESDDPVMQQWKEAKAKNPDAVIIFRNGSVYVVISDDATKVSEVAGLQTAQHGDVPICVFPISELQQIMSKVVRSGIRVRMADLVQAPTESTDVTEETEVTEPANEEPTAEPPTPIKPRVLPRIAPKEETAEAEEPVNEDPTAEATTSVKPRVMPRIAPKEEPAEAKEPIEELAEEPVVTEGSDVVITTETAEPTKSAPMSAVTAEPEAGLPHIINYGKSIVVAGNTTRIEAVLMTLWGRKRPYTHKGKTYSGIQLSAKHKKTVQEILKLVAC
ncbi:MAG: hypothetical protein IKQ07_04540 [Bacteroidaceae bacterium]|nr:hypothetical protein [Bacteroidaceae bacterium]MBR6141473.1 hypothetical protein [Bacteroidaceae bacterium]